IGKAVRCPKCQSIVAVPPGASAPSTAQAAGETKRPPSSAPGGKAPTGALSKSRTPPVPRVERLVENEQPPKNKRPPDPAEEEPAPKKKSSRGVEKLVEVSPRNRDRDEDEEGVEIPEFEVPEKYREQIEEELSKGEKLLWCGQPARRVVLVRALLYFCILGGL